MLKWQRFMTLANANGNNFLKTIIALPALVRRAMMSSGTTHIERTKDMRREELTSKATVIEMFQESPTVKTIKLKIENSNLKFKAGQWVDFSIPGVTIVGGFSMSSAPSLLTSEHILNLAVKVSTHPPAQWIHSKCQLGNLVSIKIGGDFFHDPKREELRKNILLIAGGVGINPLFSIIQHMGDLHKSHADHRINFGKTNLLYSSSKFDELLFKERIHSLSIDDPLITYKLFVTREENMTHTKSISNNLIGGRINKSVLQESINDLTDELNNILCFICGPFPMIQDMSKYLLDLGLDDSQIKYEKWW